MNGHEKSTIRKIIEYMGRGAVPADGSCWFDRPRTRETVPDALARAGGRASSCNPSQPRSAGCNGST